MGWRMIKWLENNIPSSMQQLMLLIMPFLDPIPLSWFFSHLIKSVKYMVSTSDLSHLR